LPLEATQEDDHDRSTVDLETIKAGHGWG